MLNSSHALAVMLLAVAVTNNSASAQEESRAERVARINAQAAITELWEPAPKQVKPASAQTPPSDAIVLFDGSSLAAWESVRGDDVEWLIEDGILIVEPGTRPDQNERKLRQRAIARGMENACRSSRG